MHHAFFAACFTLDAFCGVFPCVTGVLSRDWVSDAPCVKRVLALGLFGYFTHF